MTDTTNDITADGRPAINRGNESPPLLVEDRGKWLRALALAQRDYSIIRENTEPAEHFVRQGIRGFVTFGGIAGFGIRPDGELVGLFSRVRGWGDYLVSEAVRHGATHLNCFDGYLVELYRRRGFIVRERLPNWTVGGPDVVLMCRFGYNTGYAGGE